MITEVTAYNGLVVKIHDYVQCIWENNKNFHKTWKLVHISDMYYYFRDNSDGSVGKINQDQFHSQVESGYYTILQQNQ